MQFSKISILAAASALFTAASAQYANTTVTAGVVVYTTVCPLTSIYTSGGTTYTKITTTTSTITSCPGGCIKTSASGKPAGTAPVTPVVTVYTTTKTSAGVVTVYPVTSTITSAATTKPAFTGAANVAKPAGAALALGGALFALL